MTPTRPGPYRYLDPIGGPAQRVLVCKVHGQLVAVVPSIDDEPGQVPVADMAGEFEAVS